MIYSGGVSNVEVANTGSDHYIRSSDGAILAMTPPNLWSGDFRKILYSWGALGQYLDAIGIQNTSGAFDGAAIGGNVRLPDWTDTFAWKIRRAAILASQKVGGFPW